jgi:hypothetical protein
MFDPGAMGTLLIGLNAEREETMNDRRRLLETAVRRERRPGIRVALANGLRRAAAALDQPAVREATN